jgi:hypothetical protein
MNADKHKFQFSSLVLIVMIGLFFLSCEQVINPTLQSASPVLVVDAWVNNKTEKQLIVLTYTQPYFDDAQPTGASGAVVTVEDINDGTRYSFTESVATKGSYEWIPGAGPFGVIGHNYKLSISLNGEVFEATSHMGRVPPIDSITFQKDERSTSKKTRYQGQFWAKDPAGVGDTYWIRATKNDTLLNRPSEINVAYDAGFSTGSDAHNSDTDTLEFIQPIRRGITPDNSSETGDPSPFWPGDSVYVEISSITLAAFNYLNEVKIQTDRPGGFSELFARPLANVSTNINNVDPKGSNIMGFFNVGAVSARGQRFIKVN